MMLTCEHRVVVEAMSVRACFRGHAQVLAECSAGIASRGAWTHIAAICKRAITLTRSEVLVMCVAPLTSLLDDSASTCIKPLFIRLK